MSLACCGPACTAACRVGGSMNWRAGWRSVTVRLVALSLLLLLAVQGASFGVLRAALERSARSQIARELGVDENVWRHLLAQHAERLHQGAALLAADNGFRAAVASGNQQAIEAALEKHGDRVGAGIAALLDTRLDVRAASMSPGLGSLQAALAQVLPALAAATGPDSHLAVLGDVPYQFVLVPLKASPSAPAQSGGVLMGFALEQPLVNEMRKLLGVDMALRVRGADGRWHVQASTLAAGPLLALQRAQGEITELQGADGQTLLARSSVLAPGMPGAGAGAPGTGEVQVLLLRSVDTALATYHPLWWLLAAVTAAGLLLCAVVFWWAVQPMARALRALLLGTQRLSRGDHSAVVEHAERRDDIGNLARSFNRMRADIAAQQAQALQLAYGDRLTGLPNRERFRDALAEALSASWLNDAPVAVLTLDLDRFKRVNDVLGHALGNQLLQTVAARLQARAQEPGQLVARLGSNAFAVLLPGLDGAGALRVAQAIGEAFAQPLALGDQTVDLSAGIGIACAPRDGSDPDVLISRSEIAMYAAKQRTNGPQLYDPALDSASSQNLSLLTDLRRALEQGELRLYLQPKVPLQGGLGMAAEALVRWQHPVRGLVPPVEFIPFAEQTGFVRQITLWMFGAVAQLLAQDSVRALGLRVSVNLSTRDLLDPLLSARLGAMLAQHGVPASAICLEITESAIMDDPQRAEAMLNLLSKQGFRLSIDDFGTGYSSLGYLKRLPVDELKIDRSFVINMQADANDATIVRSTIDLAHNLGLGVVAEGVENADVLEQLRVLSCDEAQGYHISRPLPVDGFLAWLEEQQVQASAAVA